MNDDLELLRRYEPVVYYTEGELFFPYTVNEYVRRCSLWTRVREGAGEEIVPAGELTIERLAEEGARDPARMLCLRFVQQRLSGAELQRWFRRDDRPAFHTSGRLARVGLGPRFVDSLFSLSLLARGTVPGGTTAAADIQYQEMFRADPHYTYHGRVYRRDGYIVLQYLFFFAMNDWRSSFSGVNDHEADWEQIFVYLTECEDGPPQPAWIAYASHDYHGDDLRRRWDDPEITIEDGHPVVFAGAGSHASYFQKGEYLTSVEVRQLRPLLRVIRSVDWFWRSTLRQGTTQGPSDLEALLRIPFVDYARGDGLAIGPGHTAEWTPVLIDDSVPWVNEYRGLWGLDTRDFLAGELAPSGPKYNRDGSVRQSWYDPLGWAGLGKVAPEPATKAVLIAEIESLEVELATVDARLAELAEHLPRLDLEVRALAEAAYLNHLHRARGLELATGEAEQNALQARRVELTETIPACRDLLRRLESGYRGNPQAHLHLQHSPQPPSDIRASRFAETWAGLSIGVLLLGLVAIVVLDRGNWVSAVLWLIGAMLLVDAILHRRVGQLLLNVTIVLAVITTLVLIYQFAYWVALAALVVLALVILRDNLREVRGR